ncbi:MAG: Nif3-like dinuclear metal center hexameric protein [Nitriliruptoraceae bacterium]
MVDTVGGWTALVEAAYPASDAATWDNVGLQVGDPTWPVERVLVALDVTSAVLDEAAENSHTLIVAHHPLLFRPLSRLTPSTASGKLALNAASRRIAVTAAHTNLDVAADGAGTSVPIGDVLELTERRPLVVAAPRTAGRVKLVTFVPNEALEAVIDALADAGAGRIGDYERCSFRVVGTGTFTPAGDAHPYTGAVGQANEVAEYRLEMEVPRCDVAHVLIALEEAHPYEEAAYDLVPLVDVTPRGIGLVGSLPTPTPLGDIAEQLRLRLPAPHLRFCGDPSRLMSTVACVGGAGDSHIDDAINAGADVYITGDLRHHVTLDAQEMELSLIDAGHHATEVAAMPAFADRLVHWRSLQGLAAPVIVSRTPTVPWR